MKIAVAFILVLCCFFIRANAQTPEGFSYQAVIRDSNGEIITSKKIGLQIRILQNSAGGAAVYAEIFTPFTNEFGLVNIIVGEGNAMVGTFSGIAWGSGIYFIEIAMDTDGGSNYKVMGASRLMSVPYALHAKSVETSQELTIEGDTLSISGGNSVILPKGTDAQELTLDEDTLRISGGNAVVLPVGKDAQELFINADTLRISGGNSVLLPTISSSASVLPEFTAAEINALINPVNGTMVYCVDTDKPYVKTRAGWKSIIERAYGFDYIAYPGEDQEICGLSGQLNAAPFPEGVTGEWSDRSTSYPYTLADVNDPKTTFTLSQQGVYNFTWNSGDSFSDPVKISAFNPPVNTLIPDTIILATEFDLNVAAAYSLNDNNFEILSGIGGEIIKPYPTFKGVAGQTYVIRETITNVCGSVETTSTITIPDPDDLYSGIVNGKYYIPDPNLLRELKKLRVTNGSLFSGDSLIVRSALNYDACCSGSFLRDKQIQDLDGIQFFSYLTELDVSNNNISKWPAGLGNLDGLSRIRAQRNMLTAIPSEIFSLKSLKFLGLSENRLNTIPTQMSQLTQLKELDLGRNRFYDMPDEVSVLKSVEKLQMHRNQMNTISPQINQLTQLKILDLQENNIVSLLDDLSGLQSLEDLSLYKNKINDFPLQLVQLPNLKVLSLGFNNITSIPDEIGDLKELVNLSLGDSPLSDISPAIANLQNLRTLFVRRTNLTLAQVNELKRLLPRCRINSDYD